MRNTRWWYQQNVVSRQSTSSLLLHRGKKNILYLFSRKTEKWKTFLNDLSKRVQSFWVTCWIEYCNVSPHQHELDSTHIYLCRGKKKNERTAASNCRRTSSFSSFRVYRLFRWTKSNEPWKEREKKFLWSVEFEMCTLLVQLHGEGSGTHVRAKRKVV